MNPERARPSGTVAREERASHDTPAWVVVASALVMALLLGLCCYLLLKL